MSAFLHGFTIALAALGAVWLLMAGCLSFLLVLDALAERSKQRDAAIEEDRRNQAAFDAHTAAALAIAAGELGIEACDMELWEMEL